MNQLTRATLVSYINDRGLSRGRVRKYKDGSWYVNGILVIPPKPINNLPRRQWGDGDNVVIEHRR